MVEYIWLGILILAFVVEISTAALVSVWFMPGAFIALLLAAMSVPIWIQVLVFSVISIVMLLLSKTIFKKFIRSKPIENTNADALIGETGIVTEDIDNIVGKGLVKISSQIWSARSSDEMQKIKQGTLVRVKSIEGVKLICEKINQTED